MEAHLLLPSSLAWGEVDPAQHAFQPSEAYSIAIALIPQERAVGNEASAVGMEDSWEESITKALVERYGRWACGWRWARDEGSIGGGPVSAWCCPQHSWSTPAETAERVQAALGEWRGWIETLALRFAELGPGSDGDVDGAFEKAVILLVNDVVEKTGAGDAWYSHCEQVLGWYLSFYGVPGDSADKLVELAIGGRFESWSAPDDEIVSDIARKVAAEATSALGK